MFKEPFATTKELVVTLSCAALITALILAWVVFCVETIDNWYVAGSTAMGVPVLILVCVVAWFDYRKYKKSKK